MLRFLFTTCALLILATSSATALATTTTTTHDSTPSTTAPLCSTDLDCTLLAAGQAAFPAHATPTVTHVNSTHPASSQHHFTTKQAIPVRGDRLRFRQLTGGAAFQGRAMAQLHLVNRSVVFTDADSGRLTTYRSPLVMFGGWIPLTFTSGQNDVWASSDGGTNWKLIAGKTQDGQEASSQSVDTSFRYTYNAGANSALDPTNQYLYLMGGLTNQYQNDVWQSTNGGVTWRNQADNSRLQHTAGFYPALAANSQGHLIEATGGNVSNFGNDVWVSMDQGKTWRSQTPAAKFFSRYAQISFNVPNPAGFTADENGQPISATDFMYVIAGQAAHDNLNDVWASSDEGKTWAAISAAGPFPQRHLASGVATSNGLLIIAAGFADETAGAAPSTLASIQNDVWVSANGGYSWGRCTQDAEWDDRYLPMVAVDAQGYLIVGSGVQYNFGQFNVFNDVWRSTISFNDLSSVATACGVEIPACGVGLRCWPGADTVVATDGSYVSCAACPHASLFFQPPANGSSSVTTVVMWAFIVLSAALIAGLAWMYKRVQSAGVDVFSSSSAASSASSSASADKLLGTAETSETHKTEL